MTCLGSCYGFGVRSELPLRFLREGAGEELTILAGDGVEDAPPASPPVLEWVIRRDGVFHARLHEDGTSLRLWVAGTGWYAIDPENRTIVVPEGGNPVKREARLWGIPAVLCFTARGDAALHAAAVEIDDGAVLLAAPGTFGKTTLALAFARAGYRVLAEDLSRVRVAAEPAVTPGPALLRIRADVAELLELPAGEPLDGGDERVYLAPDESRRGDCSAVPLRAIVLLRRGDDGVVLERVDPAESLRDLWALSFALPKPVERARCFDRLAALACGVPVWNLSRPLSLDALDGTVEALVAGV
jgi:hypothetical protein